MERKREKRRSRLPKQIYILLGAAILLGLLLRQVDTQSELDGPGLLDAELILGIPPVPDLSSWPKELVSELSRVHEALAGPGNGIEAMGELGELYFANGFYGEAKRCFAALVAVDGDNARWPYFLGLTTRDFQDKSVALVSFERALDLDASYLNSRYEIGRGYLDTGQILDSVVHFERLLEDRDWKSWAHFGIANGLFLEERHEAALTELRRAIDLDPTVKDFYALWEEIELYAGIGDDEERAALIEKWNPEEKAPYDAWLQSVWTRSFDTFRLLEWARAEIHEGNADTARAMLERAARIDPGDARVLESLARLRAGL